jgi:hypothetical protein
MYLGFERHSHPTHQQMALSAAELRAPPTLVVFTDWVLMMYGGPWRELTRKHAPPAAASQKEEESVQHHAHLPLARAPSGLGGRNQRGKDVPFLVRKIAGIKAKR